jgi:hypothetical protein
MRFIRDGAVEELVEIARHAAHGRVPYADLARFLERLRFESGGTFEAPDLAALAAWSIERAASRGARLVECPECGRPRFAPRSASAYCYRPAPGKTMTCAQLHAHERFAEKRRDWNAEYRRIYARKLRGTVSEEEWDAWRSDEAGSALAPEQFYPFDWWRTPEFQKQAEQIRALTARSETGQPSFIEELQNRLRKPPSDSGKEKP